MKTLESWMLAYVINAAWQVPLLLAGGWLAARVLRPAGLRAEHRAWVGVLLLQTMLPALSILPWNWLSALLLWGSDTRGPQAGVTVHIAGGTAAGPLGAVSIFWLAIAISYAAITLYLGARFLWRLGKLSRLRREAKGLELTGAAALHWSQCMESYGLRTVGLGTSAQIFGPMTLGLRQPMVLLPPGMAASMSDADLRTVIEHEFAHLKRNDFLKNLVYEVVSLPVSFHPLLWLTREKIMESREMICDQIAAKTAGRNEYARSLLRLASQLVRGAPLRTPHAIGIFDANGFERRLMRLTRKQKEVRGLSRVALIAMSAALGIGACGSALALGLRVDADSSAAGNNSKTSSTLTVSPAEMAGNLLGKVPPRYPPAAKKAHIQGKVELAAVIGKDGHIANLKVISGPRELQQSSLDSVRQWTYKPYLLNGNPVEVKTTINVIYSLGK